jgi:hypothetical protein
MFVVYGPDRVKCKWCSKEGWTNEMERVTYGYACDKVCRQKYELNLRQIGLGIN